MVFAGGQARFFWLQREPAPVSVQDARYLPGFDPQEVSGVRIERPIKVAHKDDGWLLPAKEGSCATGRLIGDLLYDLTRERKAEPKTRDPASFAQFGIAEMGGCRTPDPETHLWRSH